MSLPRSKIEQRGRGMGFGGGVMLGVGIIRLLGTMVIMAVLRARKHRESTLIEI